MPLINTNASGSSQSGSDVLIFGLIIIVTANILKNSQGAINVPNFLICGGFVQTLATTYSSSNTCGPGIGVASGTNSGPGQLLVSSKKMIVKGSGVTYLGSSGITNTCNTACVQGEPSQYKVHVSC